MTLKCLPVCRAVNIKEQLTVSLKKEHSFVCLRLFLEMNYPQHSLTFSTVTPLSSFPANSQIAVNLQNTVSSGHSMIGIQTINFKLTQVGHVNCTWGLWYYENLRLGGNVPIARRWNRRIIIHFHNWGRRAWMSTRNLRNLDSNVTRFYKCVRLGVLAMQMVMLSTITIIIKRQRTHSSQVREWNSLLPNNHAFFSKIQIATLCL